MRYEVEHTTLIEISSSVCLPCKVVLADGDGRTAVAFCPTKDDADAIARALNDAPKGRSVAA